MKRLGLFVLLCGLYLLTYRGMPISGDETALLSSTETFIKSGHFTLYSVFYQYKQLNPSLQEPLQSIAAVPLYWLALHVEGIGLVHTVWLFNILVSAATCVLLYTGGLRLGYSTQTSFITALAVGVTTMWFPYSQTFFREPLAGFWLLLAVLLAVDKKWLPVILIGVAAVLTKTVMMVCLLALILPFYPRLTSWKAIVMSVFSVILVIGFTLLVATFLNLQSSRFELATYLERAKSSGSHYFLNVLGAYLISPGRSLWATSPVLLLCFYGAWRLIRAGNWRLALTPFLVYFLLVCAYGLGGFDWHGGRGWGSRYLLPAVPVMGLLLLPAIEGLRTQRRGWQIAAGGLVIFSLLIQLGGVLMPLDTFYETVSQQFPDNPIGAFYDQGTWQVQYTAWYIHLSHFDFAKIDVAWKIAEPGWVGLLIGVSLIAVGLIITRVQFRRWFALPLLTICIASLFLAVRTLYDDPRMQGGRPELHQLLDQLTHMEGDQDMIVLSDPTYHLLFLNYYKGRNHWITMPYQVGERYSFEQPLVVDSTVVEDRINWETRYFLDDAIGTDYEMIWLVEAQGPFHPYSLRPIENYLSKYSYPVASYDLQPNLRLIQFYAQPAIYTWYDGAQWHYNRPIRYFDAPFVLADQINVVAVEMPTEIKAGEVLTISTYLDAIAPIPIDYNLGILLLNEQGTLVAGFNGTPMNGFGLTSTWTMYSPRFDTRGLLLPDTLAPGNYSVWLVMYDWRTATPSGEVTRLTVTQNGHHIEGDYAILGTVEVR